MFNSFFRWLSNVTYFTVKVFTWKQVESGYAILQNSCSDKIKPNSKDNF